MRRLDQATRTRIVNLDAVSGASERMIPALTDSGGQAEYVARYQWAGSRVSGRVLDLGCSVGYGAPLLVSPPVNSRSVVGVDYHRETLCYASETYGGPQVAFVQADGCHLPFTSGSFDSAVCLEMIEHVPDPDGLLEEIARVLKVEGRLVVSTPNKWVSSPLWPSPQNPHHRREWYPSRFLEMVGRRFIIQEVFGQKWRPVTAPISAWTRAFRLLTKKALQSLGLLTAVRGAYRSILPHRERPSADRDQFQLRPVNEPRGRLPEIIVAVACRRPGSPPC